MDGFDYSAFAELFPSRQRNGQSGRYQRFDSAAEAVRFAMEQIPPKLRRGITIEVSEDRFGFAEIEQLYRAADYPLPRADVVA
jgi:hypothetical protein